VWSTSEHFVSCAHARQRQDGPELWEDFATFEQSRNRGEPRRRDICVEECRADIRARRHEVRGNDRDENSARFQDGDRTFTSVAADRVDHDVNRTPNTRKTACSIVDRICGTETSGVIHILGPNDGNNVEARVRGKLDRERAHVARRAANENGVTHFRTCMLEQHLPCRHRDDRQ